MNNITAPVKSATKESVMSQYEVSHIGVAIGLPVKFIFGALNRVGFYSPFSSIVNLKFQG